MNVEVNQFLLGAIYKYAMYTIPYSNAQNIPKKCPVAFGPCKVSDRILSTIYDKMFYNVYQFVSVTSGLVHKKWP